MAKITIHDLQQNEQLDRQAMAKVFGGRPGERPGPALGTQLLRQRAASASLVPAIYDPAWRFDGGF
ncbi:MAG: hypothetical protein PVJ03_02920 [Chromatiaceae bacterium]|jgi:hypothetical protein